MTHTLRHTLCIKLLDICAIITIINIILISYVGPVTYYIAPDVVKTEAVIINLPGPDNKSYRNPQVPEYIVLHSTGNNHPSATAEFHSRYLHTSKRSTSWHFSVDDHGIIQHYPITTTTWGAKGCNTGAVHIEVCQYEGMNIEKALENLEFLLGLYPELPVVSHKSCTNKDCPSLGVLWDYI